MNHKSVLKKVHRQGIIQEFNVGIDSYVSITLWCELCCLGMQTLCCKFSLPLPPPPSILLYITSRFAYMKHLFYWQLILIFLYLTSKSGVQTNYPLAWMFFFRTLTTAFPTSCRMKTVLVEFKNSAMMHAHSTSFPVLLS